MATPKIYADFLNADSHGRLRLNCVGTLEDLALHHVELREGLLLRLYSDDLDDQGQLDELLVDGVASFSDEERCWVATIDWAAISHASDKRHSATAANGPSLPVLPEGSGQAKRSP
jgi:hypothetical protein